MSTVSDADALLAFLAGSFVESAPPAASLVALATGGSVVATDSHISPAPSKPVVALEKICVFPVKSCGAFEVDSWEIDEQGLKYTTTSESSFQIRAHSCRRVFQI